APREGLPRRAGSSPVLLRHRLIATSSRRQLLLASAGTRALKIEAPAQTRLLVSSLGAHGLYGPGCLSTSSCAAASRPRDPWRTRSRRALQPATSLRTSLMGSLHRITMP